MRKSGRLLQKLTERTDLYAQSLPGVPLVEVAGDRRVLVENHQGVTEYSKTQIRIQVRYGQVCIAGSELELKEMKRDQLIVCGCIDSVTLLRGGR